MKRTVKIVNTIFATADLMDLIEITGNENEYDLEANIVAEFIYDNNPNVDELTIYIQKVFSEYFNEIFDIETMKLIADCILKNLGD